LKPKMMRYID